jgi:hypothetical protein
VDVEHAIDRPLPSERTRATSSGAPARVGIACEQPHDLGRERAGMTIGHRPGSVTDQLRERTCAPPDDGRAAGEGLQGGLPEALDPPRRQHDVDGGHHGPVRPVGEAAEERDRQVGAHPPAPRQQRAVPHDDQPHRVPTPAQRAERVDRQLRLRLGGQVIAQPEQHLPVRRQRTTEGRGTTRRMEQLQIDAPGHGGGRGRADALELGPGPVRAADDGVEGTRQPAVPVVGDGARRAVARQPPGQLCVHAAVHDRHRRYAVAGTPSTDADECEPVRHLDAIRPRVLEHRLEATWRGDDPPARPRHPPTGDLHDRQRAGACDAVDPASNDTHDLVAGVAIPARQGVEHLTSSGRTQGEGVGRLQDPHVAARHPPQRRGPVLCHDRELGPAMPSAHQRAASLPGATRMAPACVTQAPGSLRRRDHRWTAARHLRHAPHHVVVPPELVVRPGARPAEQTRLRACCPLLSPRWPEPPTAVGRGRRHRSLLREVPEPTHA